MDLGVSQEHAFVFASGNARADTLVASVSSHGLHSGGHGLVSQEEDLDFGNGTSACEDAKMANEDADAVEADEALEPVSGTSTLSDGEEVVDIAHEILDPLLGASGSSDGEEVVDITPSGCSLSSLAFAKESSAAKVKNMFVFDNTFTVLPPSIRNYKNLRKLKFFSNEVRTVPQELGDLTQLEQIHLRFSPAGLGNLPPLEKLKSLKALELHQVPARPSASSISREIAQLHSLTRLSVCHFSISCLPAEIGMLKNLEELDLSFNKLKSLPKELGGLVSLISLTVASNKLLELPSQLSDLLQLVTIDVSHNRLTSLDALHLVSMKRLRMLNAQFNKLHQVGDIPAWMTCKLEGNERLASTNGASETPGGADENMSAPRRGGPSANSEFNMVLRGRRGRQKQESQVQRARREKISSRRKQETIRCGNNTDEIVNLGQGLQNGAKEQPEGDPLYQSEMESATSQVEIDLKRMDAQACAPAAELSRLEANESGEIGVQEGVIGAIDGLESVDIEQGRDNVLVVNLGRDQDVGSPLKEKSEVRARQNGTSEWEKAKGIQAKANEAFECEEKCYDHTSDERSKQEMEEVEQRARQGAVTKETPSKTPRRQDSDLDRNPKPTKRRKSVRSYSEVSLKYYTESFVGCDDRLLDGFYDAGRDRPFATLETHEKEQPCFDSREVILVDRDKDEELEVMALAARRLLTASDQFHPEDQKAKMFQRITTLALFVSDCFGGSDKSLNISNMRRAAFGGAAGKPFVCSCGYNAERAPLRVESHKSNAKTALPDVHTLCDGSIRFMKEQLDSNIIPIGSVAYGVCRHRAILFKYLCDRADPVIPCELVRGYLDYMPHAWNVVLVDDSTDTGRMLVDACRPLDIRPENDPEYFCRYIPLKRISLPTTILGSAFQRCFPGSTLHEELDHGASGAAVHRCTLGTFTAAAKVRQLEPLVEGPGFRKDLGSSYLSELRMLCSLEGHPCIVGFYGHELCLGNTSLDRGDPAYKVPSLTLFMELVQGGSLEGFLGGLSRKGGVHMPPKQALSVARDISSALSFLHSKGIIHRDIKSSNVLVDFEASKIPVVKLCDFDCAVPLQSSSDHTCYLAHKGVPPADVCVGTPRWIAPEVLRAMYGRHSYSLEADVWSFGCLLVELLTLKVPYDGLTDTEVHSLIKVGQRPQLPPLLVKMSSPKWVDGDSATLDAEDARILRTLVRLMYSCTDPTPSKRPTAKEINCTLSSVETGPTSTISTNDGRPREAETISTASRIDLVSDDEDDDEKDTKARSGQE